MRMVIAGGGPKSASGDAADAMVCDVGKPPVPSPKRMVMLGKA
ncbi:MAG TPA: hypothetical protein VJ901_21535 [Thermoanaerobaculia bacterium]|nr:hypothetical protein [Thermoanaerobaculia bacterium]